MQCQFIILHYNASYMVLRSCSGSLLWSCQNLLGDTVWGGDKFQQVWDIHKIRWRASQQESTTNNSWPCDVLFCKDSECRMFELSNLLPAFMGAPRWDLQNSNFLLLRKSVNSATVKELHTKACQWIQVCIKADSSRISVALSHTRSHVQRQMCILRLDLKRIVGLSLHRCWKASMFYWGQLHVSWPPSPSVGTRDCSFPPQVPNIDAKSLKNGWWLPALFPTGVKAAVWSHSDI